MRRMPSSTDLNIEHRADLSRFQVIVQAHLCVANYQLTAGVMHLTHTEVPHELQGRGIAAALVGAALAHAKANGLKVNPLCSYVRAYMRRHPETMALRA
jgi:predicted GNAT family acetyltransferase